MTTDTAILNSPNSQSPQQNGLSIITSKKSIGDNSTDASSKPPLAFQITNGNAGLYSSEGDNHYSRNTSSSRSHSKENSKRRSFFGGLGRERQSFDNGDGGDGDWVTDVGSETRGRGRAMTAESATPTETSGTLSASKVGSVRKRLSMLKLGKKSSKASVTVNSVAEE